MVDLFHKTNDQNLEKYGRKAALTRSLQIMATSRRLCFKGSLKYIQF